MKIKKIPTSLFNSFFLFLVAIYCKRIVITIKTIILLLKSGINTKGFITAPKPINKHKFKILDPVIFHNNKSVS